MTVSPADAPSRTPAGPKIAASDCGESGTIVIITEFAEATSAAELAGLAPSPATSSTDSATMS